MRGPNHYRSLNDQQQHPWNAPEEDRSGQMRREDLKLPQKEAAPAPDVNRAPRDYEGEWERAQEAQRKELDEKLKSGRINQSEHTREMSKFDDKYLSEMRKQEHLAQAREAIAEARQREAERDREQSRER